MFQSLLSEQLTGPRRAVLVFSGRTPEGMAPAGARAAKREVRVCARGRSSSHATRRSILMAAAIATCCRWVFAVPQYRVRRRPKARTPCERVPSMPARRLLIALLPLVTGIPCAGGMQRLNVGLRLELHDPRHLLGLRAQRP